MVEIKRKTNGMVHPIELKEKDGVLYFQFPLLQQCGMVNHGFSTRIGGVSRGVYQSMNLGVSRGDDPEAIKENYRRMARVLEVPCKRMVLSHQTHTTNIRVVREEDAGKGLWKERDYSDIDGLITNVPELPLVTFYADCVPLFFVDPVHRAIGLSHSGWRGTVQRMGRHTIQALKEEFASCPEELLACVGPSICGDCYEVGEDVAEEFAAGFLPRQRNEILKKKGDGKYLLNLWKANELILLEEGILREHLAVTDVCTKCNQEILYSHRVMGDQRGNLAAFLSIK